MYIEQLTNFFMRKDDHEGYYNFCIQHMEELSTLIETLCKSNSDQEKLPLKFIVSNKDIMDAISSKKPELIIRLWDFISERYMKDKHSYDKEALIALVELRNFKMEDILVPSDIKSVSNYVNIPVDTVIYSESDIGLVSLFNFLISSSSNNRESERESKQEELKELKSKIKLSSLENLIILSKLMIMIQSGYPHNAIKMGTVDYSLDMLQRLRKERNYMGSGSGNTNSWQQAMSTLQEQIKLRIQMGLLEKVNDDDAKTCVQTLKLFSDRFPHFSENNQAWINSHLDISSSKITFRAN